MSFLLNVTFLRFPALTSRSHSMGDETDVRARDALAVVSQYDHYYWSEANRLADEMGFRNLIKSFTYFPRGPSGLHYVFQTRCMSTETYEEYYTLRHDTLVSTAFI